MDVKMFHVTSNSSSAVFEIIECERDGNCLFSSILQFMEQNKSHLKDVPQNANQLRMQIVNYILSRNATGYQLNWDRWYETIKFNLETKIPNITEYGKSEEKDSEIREAYRTYMTSHGKFGTFSELCAAAELFGFCGYIFKRCGENLYQCFDFGFSGSDNDHAKPLAAFLFTGPTDKGHFRMLEQLMMPSVILPGQYKLTKNNASQTNDDIHIEFIRDENIGLNDGIAPNVSKSQVECDVCKQSFSNRQGMLRHRCRHVKEANQSTANKLNQRITRNNNSSTTQESNETDNRSTKAVLDSECMNWEKIFNVHENEEILNTANFNENIEKFQKFLFKANQRLPGPQHPSIKFYRLRQKQKNRKLTSAQQSRSSNPQRTDAKAKQRRRDKFQYDLAQYWYYNQRKKVVRSVMNGGSVNQCKIKMDIMENHFKNVFGTANNKILESYPNSEIHHNIIVSEEEIRKQIKKIPLDTSAGPDRILVKTLRQLNVAKSISSIANTMLRSSFVPHGFRNGKMILIDKDGDVNSVNNWRPITIFSVIRRIIEKALDSVLRTQVSINCNQRGFVSGIAGCHINARLVNACLAKSKKFKRNCVAAFLDVTKAYDKIGHVHISKSLKSKGVSENLHDLIMSLLSDNFVEISIGRDTSNSIELKCGVPQGAPLSPILFNIAIDYLYEEICDPQYVKNNGYNLTEEYDPICLTGFADDQAVTSESKSSAIRTVELIKILFLKIGLEINPSKSQAIIISDGKLVEESLHLSDGSEIVGVKQDERIKYLGCSFNSELLFDNTCINNLNKNLHLLSTTPVLKPDQKLNIINQYIFPTLVYPLQSAPINKIPAYITDGLDVMIRRTVKEIIGLPMSTTDSLFYSPRKLRGLGLFRAAWEVYLQHFAISKKLSQVNDGLFQSISNCTEEMNACVQKLNVSGETSKALRAELRNLSFEQWCSMKYQGAGVTHFKNHTPSNDFVYNKNSLSSSEWVAAIKLSCNYANLNGVPGVGSTSLLCRKCNRENETIAHVTGSCPSNNLLISSRHHSIKHFIADLLRALGFICFEEVYAIDTDGNSRYSDIVAFHPKSPEAYIIDPTIRYETSDVRQDELVQIEKENIYKKCIPFYEEKYMESFGIRKWSVRGLWFGGRGTFGQSVTNFFSEFKLDFSHLKELSEEILIKTIHIIQNHIYN